MKFVRVIPALLVLLWAGIATAQQGPLVSAAPTPLQASTSGCYTAPAVNATQAAGTCTITVPAGQAMYINYLQVGACGDNTANAANTPQLAFTSAGLNGWTQGFSYMQGATVATVGPVLTCVFIGGPRTQPLRSATGPTTVTIVPPAQQAHTSYPINLEYYFAQ